MTVKVKDLTKPQQRIWRAARAYANAELTHYDVHETYRSTGDPADMQWAIDRRSKAASRLFNLIATTHMVGERTLHRLVAESIIFGYDNNVMFPDTSTTIIKRVIDETQGS